MVNISMWCNNFLKGLQAGSGRLLALDNELPTISLFQTERDGWNTAIIATQSGNTKHLLSIYKQA